MSTNIFAGRQPLEFGSGRVEGEWAELDGGEYYRIKNYDRMRPFFMALASSSDVWLFISSTGGVTAGRGDPDHALFPYGTDDKIQDSSGVTGSKTVLLLERGAERWQLWTPFSEQYKGVHRKERNLYKGTWGSSIIFEEVNSDLGLIFRYGWFSSRRFGVVRKAWLENAGSKPVQVNLLDGFQNLLPSGVGARFELEKSTLLDAYKRSELIPECQLGLFTLSSVPIDRPEPAECLVATTAWCAGLEGGRVALCGQDAEPFLSSGEITARYDVRGERGSFLIQKMLRLGPGKMARWLCAADVDRSHSDVAELRLWLGDKRQLAREVEQSVEEGTRELRGLVGSADGLQRTAARMSNARHYSNVLSNIMRGGVFVERDGLDVEDALEFIRSANRTLATRHAGFVRRLKRGITHREFLALAAASGDMQLERVCREYLPLTFSRRHGDPSRPWNRFSIPPTDPAGKRKLGYEGNWRDIFQNWEALARSFPASTAGMIAKFVNASTVDGYNPYRVTRNGFDWEIADPHDPWSFIGYWGDHQIVYLTRLLEVLRGHDPGALQELLEREAFAYANVPYRIKSYDQVVANPRDTVAFDAALHDELTRRASEVGTDGKLLQDTNGRVRLVTLIEKLLVPVLVKLSNFIPGAGIWLNTQRPEWNDANNALVGNGASMVTLYQLRRHLVLLKELVGEQHEDSTAHRPASSVHWAAGDAPRGRHFKISREVLDQLAWITRVLKANRGLLRGAIGDRARRRVVDGLGRAGTAYREQVYAKGLSGETGRVAGGALSDFFGLALEWIEHSIRANRRSDGLYESYNLVEFEKAAIKIRPLYLMLEGQAAILGAGCLTGAQSLRLLRALRRSDLYRADQHSYLLYPDRELPGFEHKNNLPAVELGRSALLRSLVAEGNRDLVECDVRGNSHFSSRLRNAGDVQRALEALAKKGHARLVKREAGLIQAMFETLFQHRFFTGRSGTFFAYEGLGSIYWHMVSKLLLSVQETFHRTVEEGPDDVAGALAEAYHDIRTGIGDSKSAGDYGAFPFEPYSHTPRHKGACQPGLTGQVKEDILCRWGELGVIVKSGRLCFRPRLLRQEEFLKEPGRFNFVGLFGAEQALKLPAGTLAFTICQAPVVYELSGQAGVRIEYQNGTSSERAEPELSAEESREIFARSGKITRVVVRIGNLQRGSGGAGAGAPARTHER